jgi:hypothetical protein
VSDDPRVRLADVPERAGRTTATLLASLSARIGTLHVVTGATAVGSLTAGFAALGREVGRTSEGQRLRRAIEASRAGSNGDAIWAALRFDDWLAGTVASPVLDQLRNDLALLLAPDLEDTIGLMPMPGETGIAESDDGPPTFADVVLGLHAFAHEITAAVQAIVAPALEPAGAVIPPSSRREPDSELLR